VILIVERMLTRIGNMIWASLALLVLMGAEAGCHSALSPSPSRLHHGPITVREVMFASVVLLWFAGAARLLFRKRPARIGWISSVVGAGASVCFFTAMVLGLIWVGLHPDSPDTNRLRELGVSAAERTFTSILCVMQFSVPLAISLLLFVGLLLKRRELVGGS
jgi:hypothetical protein